MELVNNNYVTGNVKLLGVAEEFGTPVYVYDANTIIEKYIHLKN